MTRFRGFSATEYGYTLMAPFGEVAAEQVWNETTSCVGEGRGVLTQRPPQLDVNRLEVN